MMKKGAPSLPQDLLVKIVFFIREWSTVVTLLEALRPANALGPLEHLWQLHFDLKWHESDFWPRLNLAKVDTNSRGHLEGIAKYYEKVTMDAKTDAAWFRQYGNHLASITWIGPIDSGIFREWRRFRITSVLPAPFQLDEFVKAFEELPYLDEISWLVCTPRDSKTIFKLAASSSCVRQINLSVEYYELGFDDIIVTSSMGEDIVQWSQSRPIKAFQLDFFKWESSNLRNEVLKVVLANPTLELFKMCEVHDSIISTHDALYNDQDRHLTLRFNDPYGFDSVDDDDWGSFIRLFFPLLLNKVENLTLVQLNCAGFSTAWAILTPLLLQSRVKKLNLEYCKITTELVIQVAQTIQKQSVLQELTILGDDFVRLSSEDTKVILAAAPPSLKCTTMTIGGKNLAEVFSHEECNEFKNIPNQRGFVLR
ncbi:hypothetical protein AeMF1_021382 [Aphanomyces euteiches]|nr:hypothetical protein AeMF1_021382 [Aphanomyces euteiches]KAH9193971.1 hypothetical protein AeNC1_004051 [Aphanomyces euteiches]